VEDTGALALDNLVAGEVARMRILAASVATVTAGTTAVMGAAHSWAYQTMVQDTAADWVAQVDGKDRAVDLEELRETSGRPCPLCLFLVETCTDYHLPVLDTDEFHQLLSQYEQTLR
jgi:hypothetical protein